MQTQLDLSQTSGDYTIKLNSAEADGNHIALGFTLHPSMLGIQFSQLSLTDKQGNKYRFHGGSGPIADGELEEWSVRFEPSTMPATDTLDLTLNIELAKISDERSEPASSVEATIPEPLDAELASLPPNSQRAAAIRAAAERYRLGKQVTTRYLFMLGEYETDGNQPIPNPVGEVVASFIFDFSLPFTPARIAELNQTVTANGIALTLDRVLISPSETVAYLRLDNSEDNIVGLNSTLSLSGLSVSLPLHMSGSGKDGAVVSYQGSLYESVGAIIGHPSSLYESDGEWRIAVADIRVCNLAEMQGILFGERMADGSISAEARERGLAMMKSVTGPWVFNFTVPPAPKQSI